MKTDYDVIECKTSSEWRKWLEKHYDNIDGVWLRMYKKATGIESINYAEALDEALCFGWIDGQKRSFDEQSFIQKFTPRRKASLWSKHNIGHIARLTEQGRMMPSGIAEVERAQQDGRWAAAYDKPSEMTIPEDFIEELAKYPKAKAFYEILNKSNLYAIAWRLQTAKKEETRSRRMQKIIDTLEANQKLV